MVIVRDVTEGMSGALIWEELVLCGIRWWGIVYVRSIGSDNEGDMMTGRRQDERREGEVGGVCVPCSEGAGIVINSITVNYAVY